MGAPREASLLVSLLLAAAVSANPIANWKELNPNPAIIPVADADTDSPTFGDGVTENSSQQAWIGALFGEAGAPEAVTLAIGETLTVSGSVVLTGGTNGSNQFRFGIFNDAGQFALDEANNWLGGWLHSSGTTPTSDLHQGRTDGPFISTAGNALDLNSLKTRTGTFDGDSVTPFTFSMSITRSGEGTIDIISVFKGGDGDLSEEFVLQGVATSLFTYTAHGWLFGGSSGVEQVKFSDVEFSVSSSAEARITGIRFDGTIVEVDYEGLGGRAYALDSGSDLQNWPDELTTSLTGSGTYLDDLAARFGNSLPDRLFYRFRKLPSP